MRGISQPMTQRGLRAFTGRSRHFTCYDTFPSIVFQKWCSSYMYWMKDNQLHRSERSACIMLYSLEPTDTRRIKSSIKVCRNGAQPPCSKKYLVCGAAIRLKVLQVVSPFFVGAGTVISDSVAALRPGGMTDPPLLVLTNFQRS
jgi:hypothetical protein